MAFVPGLRGWVLELPPAVGVPPQVLVAALGVATTTLAGKVSVKATPVAATGLAAGFVMVKLSVETPFGAISVGLNALLIAGGSTTKIVAEAVPPVTVGKLVPLPL